MASNFPSGLDSFTNPTATDTLNSDTVPHAAQHADVNDAVEAIEATLGVDPQGGESTVGDRIGAIESDLGDLTSTVTGIEGYLGSPYGDGIALEISQVSATGPNVLSYGTGPGEVDSTATGPAAWYKFDIGGTEYGIPGYAINPIV